ncbi:MAG: methyl-accepting chemotaxis protein [Butyrivibrio sp.]|uniref:methyl-accepting chemotaxis protein n=1 Tax=Butyrivibrio sp. TaxID=28121 RepID=UPI001B00E681|nr:methyl-accepting chemotaxis protein [Butyrivibrio sp.]MBO6240144.1 methyl-accepting chemotaxis protein [Butyrivibrio sp.]
MAKEKKVKNPAGISFKDSIKTKLITVMLLVAAIPLIVAVIVSYITSTTKAKNDAIDVLEARGKYVEAKFSEIVSQNIIALQTFAGAPSTITYLQTYNSPDAPIPTEVVLAQMDAINTNIDDGNVSVILSLASGEQLIRADRNALANIADRAYFQQAVSTKKPAVSDIVVSKSAGNRITIICVPIFDDVTGEVIGTIQRSFDLNNLHDFLAENISDGYITDTTGMMAAHAQFEITTEDEYDMSSSPFMTASTSSGFYEQKFSGNNTFISWIKEPVTGYYVAVAAQESEVMAEAIRSALIVVIIGIILVIVAIVISFMMAKSFTEPVEAVGKSLQALSDGRFVKVERFDSRKDEFGAISKATNAVITKLDDIVANIKASAEDVGVSSTELSDMANQISQTAEDVSNAVQEIASGATQQADEIQSASENVGRIGEAVGDVQRSTDDLSGITEKMKEASEISSKSLADLQNSSNEMTEKIDEISQTIQATQQAVNNISEKVEGITSIATQTNLLSLNASIEAARAGEAGKGFAVVAEEIGKLAEDSKTMADDIRKEMDILLEQAQAAVGAAEDVRQGNNDQQIALGETLDAVNGMLEDIGSTVGGVQLISRGADTCDTSKNAVVDTMSALSAISEENAASSEETGASMQELSATVTTLASSANGLKEIADKLNEEMKFFKS